MKEYRFIFGSIHRASPGYIGVNMINVLLQNLSFFGSLVFYKVIVDLFLYGRPELGKVIAGLALFYAAKMLCDYYGYWTANIYNRLQKIKIGRYVASLVYRKCRHFDLERYERPDFYDEYTRAVGDGPDLIQNTADLVSSFVSALLKIGTVVGLFFTLGPLFILLSAAYCILSLVTLTLTNRLFYEAYMQDTPLNRKTEYINGIFKGYPFVKELKLYRAYPFFIRRYGQIKDRLKDVKKKSVHMLLRILFASNLVWSLLKGFVNIFVICRIFQGVYTVGDFTFIFASVLALSDAASGIINIWPDMKNNRRMIGSLVRLLDEGREARIYGHAFLPADGEMEICFDDVSFAYPNQKGNGALRHISLRIHEGDKIAVVGENGSGKSTFIKLLLGLYEPAGGSITMNGKGYSEYDREEWQKLFGVVHQDYLIYQVTIAQNILFKTELTDGDEGLVWEALEFAGLDSKVQKLEKGIRSVLFREFSEEGVFLSGGEYQRLAIARAYARGARWIVFDEPTSALDPIAADGIMSRLYRLGDNKTVVCVSHRLTTTCLSDCIFVFGKGSIMEYGSHEELMDKRGIYYDMFMKQAGGCQNGII